MRNLLTLLESWVLDDESIILSLFKFLLVFGGIVTLLIWAFIAVFDSGPSAMEQCHQKGGAWAVTGQHTVPGGFWSGKVWIPTTTRVTDYGCVKHSGEPLP